MRRVLGSFFFVLMAATAAFAQSGTAVVTADRTSVRDRAATDGAVVATVTKNESLTVISMSGSWLRVRTASGAEGFVHSLFVTQSVATAPNPTTMSAPAAPVTSQASGNQGTSMFANTTPVAEDRKFGLGLGGGGLSFGLVPSARYWFNGKVGAEAQVSFYSAGYGGTSYRHTAISPSLLFRFGDTGSAGSFRFLPYAGGGATIWRYSSSYRSLFDDFSDTSVTFGAFVGGEAVFDRWPKFTGSGSIGYYTSPDSLGLGGLYVGIGFHYYIQ